MFASVRRLLIGAALLPVMAACATTQEKYSGLIEQPAVSEVRTDTQSRLRMLPPPTERAAVAVYSFEDQTGQFKPSEGVQTLSRAVTQGSTSVLLKALQDAGDRSWFTVIERENLDNLLKERQIIREMRKQYLGEEELNQAALPPLLFAGIILEGGVIGYDTNTLTGGAGARFLGIGAKTDYREDKVTVYLRAVSVKSGEVITSVVASKKIASIGVAANAFRFVSFKELLEVDTGITTNEPDLLALRQATEKAVELLIMEGAALGIWEFQDQVVGAALMEQYLAERDGIIPEKSVTFAQDEPAPQVQKTAALSKGARAKPAPRRATSQKRGAAADTVPAEETEPEPVQIASAAMVKPADLPIVRASLPVSHEGNQVARKAYQPTSLSEYEMQRVVSLASASGHTRQ
ncbi:CsgG/HfaB family protein [Hyphomonas sp.]|uniref:CsgG/HfaB family protein n=1 Tax=Hyphomonas sp. TaxID=87 RepID=UPI00391B72A0